VDGAPADANEHRDLGDAQPAVEARRRRLGRGTGEALGHERFELGVNGRRQRGGEDLGEPGIVCGGRCMHVPDVATSGGLTPYDLRSTPSIGRRSSAFMRHGSRAVPIVTAVARR